MRSRSQDPRHYGRPPFGIVVVHGGPGAAGSLAPVARELAAERGVLEPWQSARSVAGQVSELARQIERWADPPVTLVGHSWGAWLSLLVAGEHPELVRRVILIGSGPFRVQDTRVIRRRRRARLSPAEWQEYETLGRLLSRTRSVGQSAAMRRLGELAEISDSFDVLPHPPVPIRIDPVAFRNVGAEAARMRRSGSLIRAVRRVRVPVLVLHGLNDPHPVQGVVNPLRHAGVDLRVVPFERCGHEPWWERHAHEAFFEALRNGTVSAPRARSPRRPQGQGARGIAP